MKNMSLKQACSAVEMSKVNEANDFEFGYAQTKEGNYIIILDNMHYGYMPTGSTEEDAIARVAELQGEQNHESIHICTRQATGRSGI